MDIKQVLTLIESAEQQKQPLTEGKNMAKEMVMQHYTKQEIKTPIKRPINRLNEYFKVVDNEMLNVIKEEQDAKRVEVKKIVGRVLERLDEDKKVETPKPRNYVAKNAMKTTSGAGAHRDKKKEQKQGYEKHKGKSVEQGVAEGPFTGIGKMMMKHKLKKGIRQDQDDEDDAFDNMHDYDFDDELRFGHEDEFKAAYDAKRRKEKALARLSRKSVPEGQKVDEPYMDKVISSLHKDALGFRPDHEFGREWMSSSFEEKQKIYYNLLSLLDNDIDDDVSEGPKKIPMVRDPETGEKHPDYGNTKMMARLAGISQTKKPTKNRGARIEAKLQMQDEYGDGEITFTKTASGYFIRHEDEFGDIHSHEYDPKTGDVDFRHSVSSTYYDEGSVAEDSDFGEPREILEDVLRTLEREVEWPLTDVMDPREVKQLLAPVVKAVNDKLMKMTKMGETFGRRNNYYNPLEYERGQQRQMDYEKQAFKRAELQHELGHEDDPDFERKLRDKDRGPWYIKIDGKIYKQKGEPKMFDWKKGANNYALAILKNKPELKSKILLTRKPVDDDEGNILESKNPHLVEKAVSKAQQRFMGMVHAAKKGKKPASKAVADVAKGMSAKAAKDFAKTKHKGLPDKKNDEGVAGPKKCWPGHRKVGTQPGTGKNAGKRVNDCEKIEETIKVGSPVKVYSNVLKKPILGAVVELREGKAYVNYANTKIIMGHPLEKIELLEATAVAPAAAGIGSKLARFIPGVGLAAGGYDAYQRAKQGDYTGAAISAGAGLAGLVPGVGTAAATGLIGAQLGRDKARTGSFLPSYDEIGAAGKQGQAATAAPVSTGYTVQKGDNLTKIAKANNTTVKDIMAANPQITDPNKIQAGAKLNLPGQSATPAPGANVPNPAPQAAAPKATPAAAPGANVPNPQPDVSAGGASVTDRKVTQQTPTTTKQGDVTTTTSGSSASGTLKGITQDMIINHPVYKAEMAKVAGQSPQQVRMAQRVADMKARDAILRDPSYLQNYKAPAPVATGNSKIDNF